MTCYLAQAGSIDDYSNCLQPGIAKVNFNSFHIHYIALKLKVNDITFVFVEKIGGFVDLFPC